MNRLHFETGLVPGSRLVRALAAHAAAPTTLLHALARACSSDRGITLLPEQEEESPEHRSYAELAEAVWNTAASLQRAEIRPGQRVLLVLPTGWAFAESFLACQLIGAIPVPAYPPPALQHTETALARLRHMIGDAQIETLITDRILAPVMACLGAGRHSVNQVLVHETLPKGDPEALVPELGTTAFFQYTSGSTSRPKGVVVTHAALMANILAAGQASGVGPSDRMVSWLPLYHDMGLVGGLLWPIFWQIDLVLMSPMTFLQQPRRWLQAISEFGGTITMAPNFAYARCVKRIAADESLDLSSWRLALNGAEPVSPETTRAFYERFRDRGLRRNVMFPCYGLAESVVAVTFSDPEVELVVDTVDRDALAAGRALPSEEGVQIVSCGRAVPGHSVQVVDADGGALPDRQVGEIVVRGPSVMSDYHRNPEATRSAIREGTLHTGDLGYLVDGYLYVTGRAKDLIIVRGKNFYAEDIEAIAESVPGLHKGSSVAFAVYDEQAACDRVILVVAGGPGEAEAQETLSDQVRATVSETLGLAIAQVSFVPRGSIPKTPSGKRQRQRTKQRFLAGTLAPPRTNALRVALRFVLGATSLAGRRLLKTVA